MAKKKDKEKKPDLTPKISPEQQRIFQAILQGKADIRKDPKWRYWTTGDDSRTCPLLGFVHDIETHGGTLIFIPDADPPKLNTRPITRKDIFPEN